MICCKQMLPGIAFPNSSRTEAPDKQTTHMLQCFDLQEDISVDAFLELPLWSV